MNHTKTEYDLRWSGRVGDFCSTDGSSRVKGREYKGKDGILLHPNNIRGYMWESRPVTDNRVLIATLKRLKFWLRLSDYKPL
jgi:hypothetical protein